MERYVNGKQAVKEKDRNHSTLRLSKWQSQNRTEKNHATEKIMSVEN